MIDSPQHDPSLTQYGGVDQPTSDLVQNFYEGSQKSEGDYAKYLRGGLDVSPDMFANQSDALKMPDTQTLSKAIEQRAMRTYRSEMAKQGVDIGTKAMQMKFDRLRNAAQLVSAEHQQNERARMNRYQAEINKRRARASTIGNILGIGGAIGGAMAGGPAGAMAGYQMGQGVGQMSGGGM